MKQKMYTIPTRLTSIFLYKFILLAYFDIEGPIQLMQYIFYFGKIGSSLLKCHSFYLILGLKLKIYNYLVPVWVTKNFLKCLLLLHAKEYSKKDKFAPLLKKFIASIFYITYFTEFLRNSKLLDRLRIWKPY